MLNNPTMIPEKQIPTKAFVVDAPKAPFILKDVVLDEVRDNEVLVEVKYTGLCHTVCTLEPHPEHRMLLKPSFLIIVV